MKFSDYNDLFTSLGFTLLDEQQDSFFVWQVAVETGESAGTTFTIVAKPNLDPTRQVSVDHEGKPIKPSSFFATFRTHDSGDKMATIPFALKEIAEAGYEPALLYLRKQKLKALAE